MFVFSRDHEDYPIIERHFESIYAFIEGRFSNEQVTHLPSRLTNECVFPPQTRYRRVRKFSFIVNTEPLGLPPS